MVWLKITAVWLIGSILCAIGAALFTNYLLPDSIDAGLKGVIAFGIGGIGGALSMMLAVILYGDQI